MKTASSSLIALAARASPPPPGRATSRWSRATCRSAPRVAAGRGAADPLQHARPALAGPGHGRLPDAVARRPLERLAARRRRRRARRRRRPSAHARLARRQPRLVGAGDTASSSGTAGACHAAARLLPLVASRPRPPRSRCERSRSRARRRSCRARSWEADEKIIAREAALRADAASSRSSTTRPARTTTRRPRRRRSCAGSRSTTCRRTAGTTSATTSSSTASAPSTRAAAAGSTRNVIGAHALGFNTGTVGVALIGNFTRGLAAAGDAGGARAGCSPGGSTSRTSTRSRPSIVHARAATPKFKAGKVVTLRAISGHRDTGPTECPGNGAYALLPSIARARVAQTGLPKLYAAAVTGSSAAAIRFQGAPLVGAPVDGDRHRLAAGEVVATAHGRLGRSSTGRGARAERRQGPVPLDDRRRRRRCCPAAGHARRHGLDGRPTPTPTAAPATAGRRPRPAAAADARRAGQAAGRATPGADRRDPPRPSRPRRVTPAAADRRRWPRG